MENIEDIKSMWINLNNRLNKIESDNIRLATEIKKNKYKSFQEKLINKYCKFIILESLMAFIFPLIIISNPSVNNIYRLPTIIYWVIFFVASLLFDLYLMLQVKNIDLNNYCVSKVAQISFRNWKLHKLWIIIALPFAFGAIYLFALCLKFEPYVLLGIACGGCIGLAIGIKELFKFHSYYKSLYSDIDI